MLRKFATLIGTLAIVGGFVFLIGFMAAMKPKIQKQDPVEIVPAVFYAVAEASDVTLDVLAQGEVRPRTDISLTAQVAGRVIATGDEFVDGGAFEKDDVLIRIEDAQYRATAAAAKSRLAQEEAEASLARKEYEDLGPNEKPTALALRLPQLDQARAEYDAAKLNLERTVIRAPFKGRVRERIAGLGQYVAPGAQLGRIFSTDVAEIRLPLTDDDLARLGLPLAFVETKENQGPPVTLSAYVAGDTHEWTARIARTDGAIDPTTRQIAAIAVVDDPYGKGAADDGTPLAIGLYVDAHIRGRHFEDAIVLPRAALYGTDTVYVIGDDDRLEKRIVRVASTSKDTITLASGIEPGERVTTSPLRGATAGDKVTPTDPDSISENRGGGESPTAANNSGAAGGDRQ